MSQLVIEAARNWLGTPFIAGASVVGIGCDCAGLIEGVARDLGIACPSRDTVQGDILAAASAMLVPADNPMAGALVLLSRDLGGVPVHGALVTDSGTIIHAHWRAGVVENRFGCWFTRRLTHIFAWPLPPASQDI